MKPLVTYFLLAYLLSWMAWLPLYAPALGWGGWPMLPFQHAIGGLGPLLASVICTRLFGGAGAVKRLAMSCTRWRPLSLLLVALFTPFLLEVAAAYIALIKDGITINGPAMLTSRDNPHTTLAPFFLYNLVFFGFGEEVGWRGFALPRLQRHMGPIPAALLLTIFWALWHLPLFLYRPGYTTMNVAGASGWVLSLLTGSLLLSWLYNGSKGSLLACAVFHATVDIAFTAAIPQAVVNYMGMLITVWGIVILFFLKRDVHQPA